MAKTDGGRAVPHSVEAEESLLGAMLLSRDAVAQAVETVDAADFFRPLHGHIFDAIRGLWLSGDPVDSVTVDHELRNVGMDDAAGGLAGLMGLQANTPASSSAARYARIVRDAAVLRRLIGAASSIATIGYEYPDDADDAVTRAEAVLDGVRDTTRRGSSSVALADGVAAMIDAFDADVPDAAGLGSGLASLDALLVGMRPGDMIVVGARPGIGKSLLGVHLARSAAAARPGGMVVYVSAEMGAADLSERFVAADARVDLGRMRRRALTEADWRRVSGSVGRLAAAPVVIEDDPNVTLTGVRSAARRHGRTRPVSLIVVDYLQLMTPERAGRGENRQVDVSELSRGLKIMARDLRVPIVALSQLSRAVEARSEKRPVMSDLRESGSIENDADAILLLYRDEMYDPASAERGTMEINVAKQRNGPTGVVTVLCDASTGRVWDVPAEDAAEPLRMI